MKYFNIARDLSRSNSVLASDRIRELSDSASIEVYENNMEKVLDADHLVQIGDVFEPESSTHPITKAFYDNGIVRIRELLDRFFPYSSAAIKYIKYGVNTEKGREGGLVDLLGISSVNKELSELINRNVFSYLMTHPTSPIFELYEYARF